MRRVTGFTAYPARPAELGATIGGAIRAIQADRAAPSLRTWEESDVAGRFLITPILSSIEESDILVADITSLNFNVVFEIGYAIGRRKRAFLIRNAAFTGHEDMVRQVGIFDTLGYQTYTNSDELAAILSNLSSRDPLPLVEEINTGAPVYLVLPRTKTDVEIRLISRVKKARQTFRSFDPEESGRLAAGEAIENVAQSHGVIVPLLAKYRTGADVHNYRAAFVAGIALALERELLILQQGEDPVPLDYRDLVSSFQSLDQIHQHVSEFSLAVGARFQRTTPPVVAEPRTFLERLNLGASAAENELRDLGHYYIETDEYRRALRGEVRVITGRKGAGKTALFAQLRDKLRRDKSRVVLDLKPEGFQLLKFKERVLDYLEEGTKEHTITAFWEYLLFLETCHKLLEKDKQLHMRDEQLFQLYRSLEESYRTDRELAEGDFSERMVKLTETIADDFTAAHPEVDVQRHLGRGEITELLYRHDLASLRNAVVTYLGHKEGLWILFDNLDKGWPAHGVTSEDVLTLRSLIEAMAKIERELGRRDIECHGMVFIRNDVYELLVANTADRGKTASINLDWTDPDLLREVLRRRFLFTDGVIPKETSFDSLWRQIAVTHIHGEESSQYLIDRSLMRPRALIELLRFCRSHAVNLGHERIEAPDIIQGEEHFSNQTVENIEYEIADIYPEASDILWEFFGAEAVLAGNQIRDIINNKTPGDGRRILDLLLWYAFFGVIRETGETAYIYSVAYEMRRLQALIHRNGLENTRFRINPAFWRALEIQPVFD